MDFQRQWWCTLWARKFTWLFILSCEMVVMAVQTLVPLLLGIVLNTMQIKYFIWLVLGLVILEVYRFIGIRMFSILQLQIIEGLQYSAYRFFLSVDPVFHVTRISGRLFAKIERGKRAYEDVMDIFVFEFFPIIISIVTVIFSCFLYDLSLGLVVLGAITVLASVNIGLILLSEYAFEKKFIKADDTVKSMVMESLTQVHLVRSTFSADEWNSKVRDRSGRVVKEHLGLWFSFSAGMLTTLILYMISIGIVGYVILNMVNKNNIGLVQGTVLLVTYFHGTYELANLGRKTQKLIRALIHVKNSFGFIREFGEQTFPLLEKMDIPYDKIKQDKISIVIKDLHFSYSSKVGIFEGHNLFLEVAQDNTNKLYGIIGPSGIGKTTLLSVVGGQMRPTSGAIEINGIDVYSVNEEIRRCLIALQGQVASNLSGTVRNNLLLGVPENLYTTDFLIDLLRKVGLWGIFEDKEGLDSIIGEGGLNLSLGQRQRLNFASLYIRAKQFKPKLVLIDEPTSSLDEVSEKAITDMIDELAQDAVVFVVAHRINTLQKAGHFLDASLLYKEKDLIFHTREELMEKSEYYRRLVKGDLPVE